jgi:hypothetical protein
MMEALQFTTLWWCTAMMEALQLVTLRHYVTMMVTLRDVAALRCNDGGTITRGNAEVIVIFYFFE